MFWKLTRIVMAKICGVTFNECEEVKRLKEQIICDFQDFLHYVERGRYFDYEQILEKISLVDISENLGGMEKLDYYVTYYNKLRWLTTIKQY